MILMVFFGLVSVIAVSVVVVAVNKDVHPANKIEMRDDV